MKFRLTVFCCLLTLSRINSDTVTSPQIRILDVATKSSETRLIPRVAEYRNSFHPYFQQENRYNQRAEPLKSYVIYDQYPVRIFKEWKGNPSKDFPASGPQNFLERQPNEFSADYYFQNGQQVLPPVKPTLAYRSVYSNVIKVFDNSLSDGFDRNRFPGERYIRPYEGSIWKSPMEFEQIYPQEFPRREGYQKLPENFPKVFLPNEKFHFPSFDEGVPPPPKFFYPQEGYYNTHTINFNKENTRHWDEVEILPEIALKKKNQKKTFLCSFIRVNQRQFPENGPCGRSADDMPIIPPEYPDYSNLPNDKIPLEHRRQHVEVKRIKRSEVNNETRQKRNAGFGYSSWGSPFSYDSGYDGYFSDNYPSRGGYGNRNRNQGYRNRYYSRYDEYDDDYQNDDSNSRGLSGYLTNGGRRYKSRRNKNDEDDDSEEDNNNDNNRDEDSDEEMERMNSNRRDNDRRNNDDRDRRRNNNNNNNNYNDDDDYRDNRRNNNRNNSRRNNNNRRNNDRYDYNNNNRNRYYSSSNGYGSSYGGYGSYGSNYGGYGGNGGYGSSGGYGSNGGYGSYGGNGGYGYGGYGNGFGSF